MSYNPLLTSHFDYLMDFWTLIVGEGTRLLDVYHA